jgi:hypothetical protein
MSSDVSCDPTCVTARRNSTVLGDNRSSEMTSIFSVPSSPAVSANGSGCDSTGATTEATSGAAFAPTTIRQSIGAPTASRTANTAHRMTHVRRRP